MASDGVVLMEQTQRLQHLLLQQVAAGVAVQNRDPLGSPIRKFSAPAQTQIFLDTRVGQVEEQPIYMPRVLLVPVHLVKEILAGWETTLVDPIIKVYLLLAVEAAQVLPVAREFNMMAVAVVLVGH